MLTEYISVNVLLGNIKMLCQSAAKSCCIQDCTGTNNLILRQSGNLCEYISHDINRIAYDQIKGIWSCLYDLRCDRFEDIYICLCKFKSCLSWFTGNTGCDDNDVRIPSIFVVSGNDRDRISEAGSLDNIQNFTFCFLFVDIDQNNFRCDILA